MKLTPSEFFVCRLSTHNLDNRKLDVFSLRFLIFNFYSKKQPTTIWLPTRCKGL